MVTEKCDFCVGQKVRLISGGGEYPLNGFVNGGEYVILFILEGCDNNVVIKNVEYHEGYARPDQIEAVTTETTVTGPATITIAPGETITFTGNATVKKDWFPEFGERVAFVDLPSDIVGEFGVVMHVDEKSLSCLVAYAIKNNFNKSWHSLDTLRPYKKEE